MTVARDRVRLAFAFAAVAAVATLVVYSQTLHAGFRYDDYHAFRPWTSSEIAKALRGSWDPTRVEVAFYRPLTALWYALMFNVFGVNAVAYHGVSAAGIMLCAWLAGWFVFRETTSARAGFVATALYAVHPALVPAQGAWLTNQMHMLSSIAVLAALLLWQRARTRGALAWLPIAVVQIVAFGFKEDTLMLTPLILALGFLRARFTGDAPPPRPVWAGAVALLGVLPYFRYQMLGRLGGYVPPASVAAMWANFTRGIDSVLRLAPVQPGWQVAASAFSTITLGGGIVIASWRRTRAAYLLLAGLLILLVFDLPFVLITKSEQYHVMALGAVVALTGGVELAAGSIGLRVRSVVVMGVALTGVLCMAVFARQVAGGFAPCAVGVTSTDAIALEWSVVPAHIRNWLRAKPAACAAGTPAPLTSLPVITWDNGTNDDERGQPVLWTAESTTLMFNWQTPRVTFAIRRPNATRDQPIRVSVLGPSSVQTTTLTNADWIDVTLELPATLRDRLRGMHTIRIDTSPIFVPAATDASSHDFRHLGVQFRIR